MAGIERNVPFRISRAATTLVLGANLFASLVGIDGPKIANAASLQEQSGNNSHTSLVQNSPLNPSSCLAIEGFVVPGLPMNGSDKQSEAYEVAVAICQNDRVTGVNDLGKSYDLADPSLANQSNSPVVKETEVPAQLSDGKEVEVVMATFASGAVEPVAVIPAGCRVDEQALQSNPVQETVTTSQPGYLWDRTSIRRETLTCDGAKVEISGDRTTFNTERFVKVAEAAGAGAVTLLVAEEAIRRGIEKRNHKRSRRRNKNRQ